MDQDVLRRLRLKSRQSNGARLGAGTDSCGNLSNAVANGDGRALSIGSRL